MSWSWFGTVENSSPPAGSEMAPPTGADRAISLFPPNGTERAPEGTTPAQLSGIDIELAAVDQSEASWRLWLIQMERRILTHHDEARARIRRGVPARVFTDIAHYEQGSLQ